ncbi:MAG: hypothetical protein Q4B60_04225 [Erysipelotrichaceae bacterium]|nr:hypothetical protein [Erysipelotrichaceae bacterium]
MKKLLIICLCIFCLSGCHRQEVIVGDDWRTTGVILDYGQVTQNGEKIEVVLTMDEEKAMLYLDSKEHIEFAELRFPEGFKDEYVSIDFSDLNEDGSSDISISFKESKLSWVWDKESGFVIV